MECTKWDVIKTIGGLLLLAGAFVGGMFYEKHKVTKKESDCTYSSWGMWSTCHLQERGQNGTRYRVRNVLEINGCGPLTCSEPTIEEQSCQVANSYCQYSDWGDWSMCSHECGQFGSQFRIRKVTEACGLCLESTAEERPCNRDKSCKRPSKELECGSASSSSSLSSFYYPIILIIIIHFIIL